MYTLIALLRGINVSGKKKIKMDDLKHSFESSGLKKVQTYIQSGNIVFVYEEQSSGDLKKKIEEMIFESFGFRVVTFLLTSEDLSYIISNNPYQKDPDKDVDRTYITFLSDPPDNSRINALKEIDNSPEEFVCIDKTIYFYSPGSYGKAKMNNNYFEKKLGLDATTRNWKTVNTLFRMATEQ